LSNDPFQTCVGLVGRVVAEEIPAQARGEPFGRRAWQQIGVVERFRRDFADIQYG
jgi:hypothetical protein